MGIGPHVVCNAPIDIRIQWSLTSGQGNQWEPSHLTSVQRHQTEGKKLNPRQTVRSHTWAHYRTQQWLTAKSSNTISWIWNKTGTIPIMCNQYGYIVVTKPNCHFKSNMLEQWANTTREMSQPEYLQTVLQNTNTQLKCYLLQQIPSPLCEHAAATTGSRGSLSEPAPSPPPAPQCWLQPDIAWTGLDREQRAGQTGLSSLDTTVTSTSARGC